jgi:hypothetical protein
LASSPIARAADRPKREDKTCTPTIKLLNGRRRQNSAERSQQREPEQRKGEIQRGE